MRLTRRGFGWWSHQARSGRAGEEEVEKIEGEKKRATDEIAFQRSYVKKAEDNVRSLATVLDRIAAADAAAEAAAKAAEAAAKAAKK